jgi:Xaa-Pro dipeptidase
MELEKIQKYLKAEKIDGWLIADFHARNSIAVHFLDLSTHITRRSFFLIPAEGEPVALVHNIEKDRFVHLPGRKIIFSSYRDLESNLASMLKGYKKIAMEYSPSSRLPYIGLVEAGTIELVRSTGVEIVSSADMVSFFQARMTAEQLITHRKAAELINRCKDEAFDFIAKSIKSKTMVNEYMVVDFLLHRFEENNLTCDFPPCCAIDGNISNPHYQPSEENSLPIKEGALVLIDLWAKLKASHAVYADITWMGYTGTEVPDKYAKLFSIVSSARDRAIEFIREKFPQGPLYGYQVDDACREVVEKAGYGKYFFHRTGHSILEEVHGPGPNIDNIETEDRRRLLPGHLFSIEPGIYLEDCGVRTEIDCKITETGPEVTTQPLQKEIIRLLR